MKTPDNIFLTGLQKWTPFFEWFTKNKTEIDLSFKESGAEASGEFDTPEDFAVELFFEVQGIE